MKIQLIDLKRQYETIKEGVEQGVVDVLRSTQYITGPNVKSFETEFANYIGVNHAISVANGTDALVIALKSLGIGRGDEVITTSYTFFATAESISSVGAIPVFVDVRLDTFNIDPAKIEEKITSKTKAIMPVHIFGQPCDMEEINEIAKKHNLFVIEDACQAVGAEYKGKKAGSLSDIACFSFYPTKNLGCAGDGGMIVTNDDNLAIICRALSCHGSGELGKKAYNLLNGIIEYVDEDNSTDNTIYNPLKYYNYLIGHNSRLDEVQALILREKLKLLDEWNNKRRLNAKYYNEKLSDSKITLPIEDKSVKHVYHLYIIQSDNRQELVDYLRKNGVSTGIYYPVSLHLQKAYSGLCYKLGDLPNAEYLSNRTFAIPMFAELREEEIDYISNVIKSFYK